MDTILVTGLIVFCTSVPVAYLQEQDEIAFMLRYNRGSGSNIIEFHCRDSASSLDISGASFFLNGSRINDQFVTTDDGGLSLEITRDLEGVYSCGNESTRSLSNNRSLIAYPTETIIPRQPPNYAVVGDRVQIDCGIPPGRLLQQYTINWYKSTQMIVKRNSPIGSPGGRYAINSSTLSLIINNVTEADTSAYYRCELIVRDPEVQQTYDYDTLQLEENLITLIILGNFFKINVQITDDRDAVLIINLGINYNEEFRLSLLYTNLDNSSQTQEVVTSAAFRNATIINHVEFGSQVPFDRFTVRVRLVFTKGMYSGPYNDVPGEHDKNQPTVCVVRLGRDIIIVGAALSAAIVILIIIIAVILIITLACYSRKTVKEEIDNVNHTVRDGMQTIETNIEVGKNDVISAYQEKQTEILEVMKDYHGDLVKMIAEFKPASEDRPTSSTQTGRTEDDGGSAVLGELVCVKRQEDLGVLISFVSDALSAALENPQICNEMKSNVDSVIRRYWKDIEIG